jgi:hypothetical protein
MRPFSMKSPPAMIHCSTHLSSKRKYLTRWITWGIWGQGGGDWRGCESSLNQMFAIRIYVLFAMRSSGLIPSNGLPAHRQQLFWPM